MDDLKNKRKKEISNLGFREGGFKKEMSPRLIIATKLLAGRLAYKDITNYEINVRNMYELADELLRQEKL